MKAQEIRDTYLSFFAELEQRFRAPGDFARAYVIAHEVGHHVQKLLGIADKVQELKEQSGESDANALQVRMELQEHVLRDLLRIGALAAGFCRPIASNQPIWPRRARSNRKGPTVPEIDAEQSAMIAQTVERLQSSIRGPEDLPGHPT